MHASNIDRPPLLKLQSQFRQSLAIHYQVAIVCCVNQNRNVSKHIGTDSDLKRDHKKQPVAQIYHVPADHEENRRSISSVISLHSSGE